MKADVKKKWVKALRSGKYKQGRSRLKNANAQGSYFCCLGVLAEVCGRPIPQVRSYNGGAEELLSHEFLKEVGLNSSKQSILADMNDNGNNFEKIADYIEATL